MPPREPESKTESSMRDDFEKAIGAVENDDEGATTTETRASEDEQQITAESLNDEAGEEAKAEAKAETKATKVLGEDDSAESAPPPDSGSKAPVAAADDDSGKPAKAPASWTPAAREEWAKLPESVRAQINKREGEINKFQNVGAEHRKTGEKFQALADQYAQIIAAEGAPDALTGFTELAKTVATLRMGSAQQKAQKIAGFIEHYGVDISMLDDMLSAKMNGGAPRAGGGKPDNDALTQLLNDRLKPVDNLLARMDEAQRAKVFKTNQDAVNEVSQFKQGHEFYADVQNDMADMVELAEKRGYIMPLQEAYDKACALNPEISKVLSKRAADDKLLGTKDEIARKREAASSIRGTQGGGAMQDGDASMRDTISALYDQQRG